MIIIIIYLFMKYKSKYEESIGFVIQKAARTSNNDRYSSKTQISNTY